jgi:GTPase
MLINHIFCLHIETMDIDSIRVKLMEGQGEFIHDIIKDYSEVIGPLRVIASSLEAEVVILYEKGNTAEVLIREVSEEKCIDVRICVCGNVDAGKSTLVGVLTTGEKDNGRGSARTKIFKHKHEQESGRTSAISHRSIGFDCNGKTTNYDHETFRVIDKKQMVSNSSKLVTLYDLAGHEHYLKTTLFGLSSSVPDYAMVVISANNGIQRMTKEHICICLALKIPFFIIVTRIDACPSNVFHSTLESIKKLVKMPGIRKLPFIINGTDDIIISAKNFKDDKIVPIICLSNVTHENVPYLRRFLNLIPIRKNWEKLSHEASLCVIDSIYQVPGIGLVVAGMVSQGCICINDYINIGPDSHGKYRSVQIKSIQINNINKKKVEAGKVAAFSLSKYKGHLHVRKGMVMLDSQTPTASTWEFKAEIKILYHTTTIQVGYQPVIHVGSVKQSATIQSIEGDNVLRTGGKAIVNFKFMYRPEYLIPGSKLVLRENRTRGVGHIL